MTLCDLGASAVKTQIYYIGVQMLGLGPLGKMLILAWGFYYSGRSFSAYRREDSMGRQTSRRYHHSKKEFHFLLSHRYLHPHQHHPDIIVYTV